VNNGIYDLRRPDPFASVIESQDYTAPSKQINPQRLIDAVSNVFYADCGNMSSGSSNGGTFGTSSGGGTVTLNTGANAGGGQVFAFHNTVIWSRSITRYDGSSASTNFNGRYFNWSRRFRMRMRFLVNPANTANATFRCLVGKTNTGVAAIGALSASTRGIGFEVRGNAGGTQLWLTCANGTARTDTQASGVSLGNGVSMEVVVDSDGNGNAALFVDGVLAASSGGAPTSNRTDFGNDYFTLEAISTDATNSSILFERTPMFLRP